MLRKRLLTTLLAVGALSFGLHTAQASTVATHTISLTGATGSALSYDFGDAWLGLTVTARQWDNFTDATDPNETRTLNAVDAVNPDKVTISANGLGETRGTRVDPAGAAALTNSTAVNSGSYGPANNKTLFREALLFSFTKAVKIVSVTFFVPDSASISGFVFDGSPVTATQGSDSFTLAAAAANSLRSYFPTTYTGDAFAFAAKTGAANRFYIQSIEVQVVPLPAGGLLLASAVVVPFLRRKRKAA